MNNLKDKPKKYKTRVYHISDSSMRSFEDNINNVFKKLERDGKEFVSIHHGAGIGKGQYSTEKVYSAIILYRQEKKR